MDCRLTAFTAQEIAMAKVTSPTQPNTCSDMQHIMLRAYRAGALSAKEDRKKLFSYIHNWQTTFIDERFMTLL